MTAYSSSEIQEQMESKDCFTGLCAINKAQLNPTFENIPFAARSARHLDAYRNKAVAAPPAPPRMVEK